MGRPPIARRQLQNVERNFEIGWAWPCGRKIGEGAGDAIAHVARRIGAHGKAGDGGRCGALVQHLMEAATALRGVADIKGGGNYQHIAGVGPGLAHGSQDIQQAGAGDGETHAGLARGSRIAIGHEARALFVAHQDMLDFGARQGPVHFHIVDAGNAEDRIHAIGFEQAHKGFAG